MIQLKPRPEKVIHFVFNIILGLGLFYLICFLVIKRHDDIFDFIAIVFYLICILFSLPVIILPVSYLIIDLRKRVFIDEISQKILIKQKSMEIIISRDSIIKPYYVKVREYSGTRYKFPAYKYLLFVLKDGKRVYVTNLLCDPDTIIKKMELSCEIVETNVPFISRQIGSIYLTPDKFEGKVQEYEEIYKDFPNAQLANIISEKESYADYAREAASRVLTKRKAKISVGPGSP